MPAKTFLILIVAVIAAAGVTISAVYALGLNLIWLGLAAVLAAYLVRKWAK